ncbi:MAG: hypothetical protein ACI90U_001503 [Pseudomonadales bacterium]|jgi:hypothetical protein
MFYILCKAVSAGCFGSAASVDYAHGLPSQCWRA